MRIGELALATGAKPDALRFYEREGLLDPPARTDNGYRVYFEADVARVRFVRAAQSLGFSLAEIRSAVGRLREGRLNRADIEQQLHRKLAEIDAHMAQLRAMRRELLATFGSLTCETPAEMTLEGPAARGPAAARARAPSRTASALGRCDGRRQRG